MRQRRLATLVLSGVIMLLLAAIGVLAWKYHQATKDTSKQAKQTSARIIGEVSKLYLVPSDEEPTVAQIQDKTKLDNKEFFRQTENGDYLLIYKKGKVAIVYRENINKLVVVGPVNITDNGTQGQASGATTNNSTQ